jgi:hypothetical protein
LTLFPDTGALSGGVSVRIRRLPLDSFHEGRTDRCVVDTEILTEIRLV